MAADHDDATPEVAESVIAEERPQRFGNDRCVLRVHPKDGNAGMGARRVAAYVSEPTVEGDDETVVPQCGCEDLGIARTAKLLIYDGVDVMTQRGGDGARFVWKGSRRA